MKKVFLILVAATLAACGGSEETTATQALPFASLTPLVASAQPLFEMQRQIADLKATISVMDTQVAGMETELERLADAIDNFQAEGTRSVISTPTATLRPTPRATSTPSNVVTVVALRKLNLRTFTKRNDAGRPIMVIYEPRIQYQEGEIFQVLRQAIQADGGGNYFQVVGPEGAGLYVRQQDIDEVK